MPVSTASQYGNEGVVSHIGKWHSLLMRIIARKNIVAYFATPPMTRASLTHWLEAAENADWSSTIEVMADFSKAKTVTAERVRFELAGGPHRLTVAVHFRRVWIGRTSCRGRVGKYWWN